MQLMGAKKTLCRPDLLMGSATYTKERKILTKRTIFNAKFHAKGVPGACRFSGSEGSDPCRRFDEVPTWIVNILATYILVLPGSLIFPDREVVDRSKMSIPNQALQKVHNTLLPFLFGSTNADTGISRN